MYNKIIEDYVERATTEEVVAFLASSLKNTGNYMSDDLREQNLHALCTEVSNVNFLARVAVELDKKINSAKSKVL